MEHLSRLRAQRGTVPWIVYDKVLGEFGRDLSTARRAYGRFVRAGVDEPPPSPFGKAIGRPLLDSEKFQKPPFAGADPRSRSGPLWLRAATLDGRAR